jgi:hypothetical protein
MRSLWFPSLLLFLLFFASPIYSEPVRIIADSDAPPPQITATPQMIPDAGRTQLYLSALQSYSNRDLAKLKLLLIEIKERTPVGEQDHIFLKAVLLSERAKLSDLFGIVMTPELHADLAKEVSADIAQLETTR